MSAPASPTLPVTALRPAPAGDAAIALAATLLMLAFHALRGFPTLADSGGDNDSVLRLVQVRDLLAGQGWFDPTQYRMGPEGGFAMHWSRLVDLPVALLAAGFGETAALVIWPSALFALCLFLIVRAARATAGEAAVLPATVAGGLALYFVNVFPPGALDHHNVQLTLTLAALLLLLRGRATGWSAALAGVCAALMLAVGMETAPYAAAACAVAAFSFLLGDDTDARVARGFGAGFAATGAAAFAATVPAAGWLAAHCDAFSFPQASLGLLGGGGLAAIAATPALARGFGRRLAALGLLGGLCAALVLVAFPQCLSDPYAGLDPRLHSYWLGAVSEARSFMTILHSEPARIAAHYATPFVALAVLAWSIARDGPRRERMIVSAFLAAAVLVSLWQVRGSTFTIPLAAIPLAGWIAHARLRAGTRPTAAAQLAMVAAWLVSINLVWTLAMTPFAPRGPAAEAAGKEARCYAHADYAALAALPAGTVAAISNLGSSILANTPHRVLAGPYHRNQEGNLANLDVMMGTPAEAEAAALLAGVGYVALCPGNPETAALEQWAPDGLLAGLVRGDAPRWLAPVPETADGPLRLWRVRQAR